MLDESIVAQLREVFGSLSSRYKLVVANGSHAKQQELVDLARSLAETSPKLELVIEGEVERGVRLSIVRDEAPTGIVFRGIPGGHEFTSLVLAILNADGKGKLPDEGMRERIQALRGPATLRTYVALSCTNCPDVVQALNVVALYHPEIQHEMIDGEFHEDEVEKLGIQGVPSVFSEDQLLHVGKGSFAELLEVLEAKLGRSENQAATEKPVREYDVVVVGGGPAGASAAIYTARKGLKTAIVAQKFGGQVQETLGIENLIGTSYTEGARLTADLDKHVRAYPIDLLEHRRVERVVDGPQKEVLIQGGERLKAPIVIVASGAKWRELGVPGEKEYLGRGVAFCPHCDGPFYKGRPVAVVGGGNSGVEAAIDLSGICTHVTLIEFADELKADHVLIKNLESRENITVIKGARTTQVVGDGSKVTGFEYEDRASGKSQSVAVDGVFVQIGLSPNSAIVSDLVALNRFGEVVVDDKGRTNVSGIYACGDVTTTPYKQIVIAIGEGAKVALTAFEDRMRADAA
jgi:NADH-dependent peroxiredoxin subunit F